MSEPTPEPVPSESTFKPSRDQARDDYDDAPVLCHDLQPHRGNLILICGMLGAFTFWVFGIVGLIISLKTARMAERDLNLMDQKKMDPTGRMRTLFGESFSVFGIALSILMLFPVCFGIAIALLLLVSTAINGPFD